ncbi:alpha/beta hydrolase [Paraclostridium sordellii]|uniref:alpha/beta hydrolase n=1 Tax=Paraclostridium sordellii TaxID=1505 RepID=UPI0005E1FD7B|nr:alpha/beta fold hydrolase [Paeniclostridium sordellii]CEN25371.1 esterase/lipase [[Clostridium] sordellii] [Paeniclostridium sordellii]
MDFKKSYKLAGNEIGCLLIHGFTSTPAEMYPLAKFLNNNGYTVYSILLSGHGTNHDELLKVSYIDWYNDVEKAYEELLFECEEVVVIGHSMGGLLALMLASNYHVDKLICLACALKPNNRWVKYTGILKYFKKYTEWKNTNNYIDDDYRKYKLNYNVFPIHSVYQLYLASRAASSCLKGINSDTLIIQDKNDSQVKKESAYALYNGIASKNKELVWIEKGTHSLTLGPKHEEVFEQILEFIKSNYQNKAEIK